MKEFTLRDNSSEPLQVTELVPPSVWDSDPPDIAVISECDDCDGSVDYEETANPSELKRDFREQMINIPNHHMV